MRAVRDIARNQGSVAFSACRSAPSYGPRLNPRLTQIIMSRVSAAVQFQPKPRGARNSW